jgi:hypothetical protein
MGLMKSLAGVSGTGATRAMTSSAVLSNGTGAETLLETRPVTNEAAATFSEEGVWPILVQFRDGDVAAADDLVVKIGATECTTQLQVVRNWPSGALDIGKLWVRLPDDAVLSGSNDFEIYKRTQARSSTSAIAISDIEAEDIELELTSVTDYGGSADGSGSFECVVNDYINAGEPNVTELARGPVVRIFRVRVPANDTTGGAAHAGGMICTFDLIAVQNAAGNYDHTIFMPTLQMGDTASSDPDVRKFDVNIKVNGSTIAGASAGWAQFTALYMPYYSKQVLSQSDGRPWATNLAKVPVFRNALPFADWTANDFWRLPPSRATKLNSGAANWSPPTMADAQTIPTSGGDQGKITISQILGSSSYFAFASAGGGDLPGANWIRFEGTSPPTGITFGRAYCLGADTGSAKYYVYANRADAIAGTNKIIPSTGTISAGTNVVVYPAHAPNSLPSAMRGWNPGGERSELGLLSSMAEAAIMYPSKGRMDLLRCNALNLAYVPWNYRKTTTLRVPDIHTDSATYDGLGTGQGTTFMADNRFGTATIAIMTPRSGASWDLDEYSGIGPDDNHPPSPDYFYAWLHEPWPWFEDISMSWCVGKVTWQLNTDRNPTWNSVLIINSMYGAFYANFRGRAWNLRTLLTAYAMWPAAVVAGNNGERDMLDDMADNQEVQQDEMLTFAAANTPNALAMGILPMQMDVTIPNWQYGGYFIPTVCLWRGYTKGHTTADLEDLLVAIKPYGQAHGGTVVGATGTMGPTRGGTYYVGCRTYVSADLYDAPAGQWNAYGQATTDDPTITINTTDNTITLELPTDQPDDVDQAADGDQITFLAVSGSSALDSAIGIGTTRFVRDLSFSGNDATFRVAATLGGSAIDLTSATVTSITFAWHRQAEKSPYGFCNNWTSNLYPHQVLGCVYMLAWALGGMDDEVDACEAALSNQLGVATEHTLLLDAKYSYDAAICKEAA